VEGGCDEEKISGIERGRGGERGGELVRAEGIGQWQLQDPAELGSRYQSRLPSA
jgi:hypothetical protein